MRRTNLLLLASDVSQAPSALASATLALLRTTGQKEKRRLVSERARCRASCLPARSIARAIVLGYDDAMPENQLKSDVARREEEILAFWKVRDIFKKTLAKKSPKGEFVFYEGPPTANGLPGIHHLESRAFKDAIPRYRTMRGYHLRRKAGWDTHGIPVELEVEKKLSFKSKKDIEAYGVAKFNAKCKESVLQYIDEWKRFTDRIAFWVA